MFGTSNFCPNVQHHAVLSVIYINGGLNVLVQDFADVLSALALEPALEAVVGELLQAGGGGEHILALVNQVGPVVLLLLHTIEASVTQGSLEQRTNSNAARVGSSPDTDPQQHFPVVGQTAARSTCTCTYTPSYYASAFHARHYSHTLYHLTLNRSLLASK
jgi:hypothetical protein